MIKLYTDAAFRPNTKEGGIGIIIEAGDRYLYKYYLDHVVDNHWLEFLALKLGLQLIEEMGNQDRIISIYTDSKIVAASIEKRYVKNSNYQANLEDILLTLEGFELYFTTWIPEKANLGADQLAKQALNKQGKSVIYKI